MLAVEVIDLVRRYGPVAAVDGVSLDVRAGEVVALLGPNGAGKTSTVECVAGFSRPDGGTVRVLGRDPVGQRAAVVPHLGVMLQEGGAWQAATPRELVRLYARLFPSARPTDEVLADVGLLEVAERRYRVLSGGEKQRVNLALALVGRPRVLLLDEPTAGMDPGARQTCWALLRRLRDDGAAILLTTHAMDEAERLADRVVLVAGGRVAAQGAPNELVARLHPADRLVVTSPATVDADGLARELSRALAADVAVDGAGRWIVAAGPQRIADVGAWFAARGLPLSSVGVDAGLEDVVLALTRDEEARLTPGGGEVAG